MRSLRYGLVVLLGVAFVGCSGLSVDSVHDVRYDFASLGTYSWAPKDAEQGADLPYDLIDRMVKPAVERELNAKGFTKGSGNTTFQVIYYIGMDEVSDIVDDGYYGGGFGDYWGGGWYGPGAYGGGVRTIRYDEGTLTIDIIGTGGGEKGLIWRGTGKGTVEQGKSSEQLEQDLSQAVAKIMERFPPAQQ